MVYQILMTIAMFVLALGVLLITLVRKKPTTIEHQILGFYLNSGDVYRGICIV